MKQRLLNKIKESKSGCWEWQGAKKKAGYGNTTIGSRKDGSRKTITTHRAMWIAEYGHIPDGLWVLHKCDNPCCINPDHLYLGNRADNVRDREERGRNVLPCLKHEQHPNAKLNWKKVNEIRELGKTKTHQEIADIYNMSRRYIGDVLSHKTWIPANPLTENNQ